MRNILAVVVVIFSLFSMPSVMLAHGGESDGIGSENLRQVEDQVLNDDELHERMETLMQKLLSDENLSAEEEAEVIEHMREYPGVHSMMMGRFMGSGVHSGVWRMHPWGMGAGFFWFPWLIAGTWFVVGILAIIWLVRKIKK